jgi:long-chain acyl-CoA synthetase
VTLSSEQFTADNGLITPTFKLKRAPLQARFQGDIDAMYAALRATTKVGGLEAEATPAGGKAAGKAAKVTANLVARAGRGGKVVAA